MALFDKLDDLRGKATEMMQTGVDKATEMMQAGVTIAKLKTDNIAEEDAMRRAYLAIGKMYFELYGESPDPAFATECDRIRACKRRIAENNLRLAEMKDTLEPPQPPVPPAPPAPHPAPKDEPVPFEAEEEIVPDEYPPHPEPDVVPFEEEEIAVDELK